MTTGRCARTTARALAFVAATLALAGCAGQDEPGLADLPGPDEYAQQLFEGANEERTAQGLTPLEWSDCLVEPATERAQVAADNDSLEHQVLSLDCAEGAIAGENLSRADVEAQEIVNRWMDSAGHRANIVNEGFVVGAVGCVADDGLMTCSWLAHGEPDSSGGGAIS
ncbi:CAP domain-containing protein [Demequina sp. SO4-18]|uniref:CAP domain-containing protein n=1 Tax=Demequina sp. SO4-18 TaxID=3401026 RepID=UPI003B5C2263